MLRNVIPVMLDCPECSLAANSSNVEENAMIKFWFPVLFGFYDIIMNGEDLEVRRLYVIPHSDLHERNIYLALRALDSLFTTLKTYGATYPVEFWDTVCQELLFPIFAVLKSSQDLSRFTTQEDMSVWLSTTMIQALRDLIDLYTFYFDILERFLDGLLDLLCVCICQGLKRILLSAVQNTDRKSRKRHPSTHWNFLFTAASREKRC